MNRRIVIIFLILLTLGLAGVSVYIALQVTREQSPEDSGATEGTACHKVVEGNCFTLSVEGGTGTCTYNIKKFHGPSCPTSLEQSGSDEAGTLTGSATREFCTQGASGTNNCEQIDDTVSQAGVCACGDSSSGGDDEAVCGESCDSDSDCVSESAAGDPVECRNGTCQLPTNICPDGHTVDGANCACNFENACGERCGDGYGECSDGFRCTYASGPACDPHGIRYCVSEDDLPNNYEKHTCTSGDEFGVYVEKPDGTSGITAAQANSLCEEETLGECNDLCGSDANGRECTSGMICTNDTASGNFRCRLETNPSSGTCEQTDASCNDFCGSDANGRQCESGLTCTLTATGKRKCRLASNPHSNECLVRVAECNETCSSTVRCRTGQGETCIGGVCRLTINPNSTTCEPNTGEPAFSITKSATPVCVEGSDNFVLSYTITVENFGDVEGTIDQIVDTYDAQITSLGFSITAITPTYGTNSGGTLTWTGNASQRTYDAGESKTFTYTVTIPKDQIESISEGDLANTVVVQYDTPSSNNNTSSFDLIVEADCSYLPTTGILDDNNRFMYIALVSILMAVVFYKFNLTETALRKVKYKFSLEAKRAKYQDKMLINISKRRK